MTISFVNSLAVMAYLSWRILKAFVATARKQRQEAWVSFGLDDFSSDSYSGVSSATHSTGFNRLEDSSQSDISSDYSRDTSATPSTEFRGMEDFSSSDSNGDYSRDTSATPSTGYRRMEDSRASDSSSDILRDTIATSCTDDISVYDNDDLNVARFLADTTETSFDFENSYLDLLDVSGFTFADGTSRVCTLPGLPLFIMALPPSELRYCSPSTPTPTSSCSTPPLSNTPESSQTSSDLSVESCLPSLKLPRHRPSLSTSCQTYSNMMNNSELSMTI